MDPRIAKLKSTSECEAFARNALAKNLPELAEQARRRSIDLRADAHAPDSEVERECWRARSTRTKRYSRRRTDTGSLRTERGR